MRTSVSVLLAVGLCCVVSVSAANAGTQNVRPLTLDNDDLQNVFDSVTVGGTGIDAYNDQSPHSLFTSDASGGAVATFVIELAGFASTNQFGLYNRDETSNKAMIFDGADTADDMALIQFYANGDIYVNFALAATGFSSDFGFYLDVYEATGAGGGDDDGTSLDYTLFSEDSENAGGTAQAMLYQGDDDTVIQIGGLMPGTFTDNQYIVAFEDLRIDLGASADFTDLVVMVESITAIPAPAAVLLGLLGLPMVGWVKRRLA